MRLTSNSIESFTGFANPSEMKRALPNTTR